MRVEREPLLEVVLPPTRAGEVEDEALRRRQGVERGAPRLVQLRRRQLLLDAAQDRTRLIPERRVVLQALELLRQSIFGGRQLRDMVLRVARDPFLPRLERE